jgi:uncharacterized membrane protein
LIAPASGFRAACVFLNHGREDRIAAIDVMKGVGIHVTTRQTEYHKQAVSTSKACAPSSSTGSERRGEVRAALGRLSLVAALLGATLGPAAADFRVCNKTASPVGVALGYKDNAEGWTTNGWWTLSAHSCETLIRGALARRYYFIHAVDADGVEWSGGAMMCTRDTAFTIRGFNDCRARGYDEAGFYEVDTGHLPSYILDLTEPSRR